MGTTEDLEAALRNAKTRRIEAITVEGPPGGEAFLIPKAARKRTGDPLGVHAAEALRHRPACGQRQVRQELDVDRGQRLLLATGHHRRAHCRASPDSGAVAKEACVISDVQLAGAITGVVRVVGWSQDAVLGEIAQNPVIDQRAVDAAIDALASGDGSASTVAAADAPEPNALRGKGSGADADLDTPRQGRRRPGRPPHRRREGPRPTRRVRSPRTSSGATCTPGTSSGRPWRCRNGPAGGRNASGR